MLFWSVGGEGERVTEEVETKLEGSDGIDASTSVLFFFGVFPPLFSTLGRYMNLPTSEFKAPPRLPIVQQAEERRGRVRSRDGRRGGHSKKRRRQIECLQQGKNTVEAASSLSVVLFGSLEERNFVFDVFVARSKEQQKQGRVSLRASKRERERETESVLSKKKFRFFLSLALSLNLSN